MSAPPTSASAIRRVVTGQAKDGTSVIASDTSVPPIVNAALSRRDLLQPLGREHHANPA